MELAVVGDPLFVLGFRLAGVRKTFEASDAPGLQQSVRSAMKDPDVGVLVMETRDRPTLVAIGAEEDSDLREKLKQAVGVDLWK
ncbi:MAG: V-type ATP synthase subunit F [Euryarchaeota archaeon]|nr:V-type ATP synthase subunit F [Euryarchaeota archaeon]